MTSVKVSGYPSFAKKLVVLLVTFSLTVVGLVASPVAANAVGAIQKIAVGADHMCALMVDGTVNCVGNNSTGELGNNSTTSSTVPVKVYGITNAVDVSAGSDFSCATLVDGTARCWGSGALGQLGDGNTGAGYFSQIPVAIQASNVQSINSNRNFSCYQSNSGSTYCWGNDYSTKTYVDAWAARATGAANYLPSGFVTQSGMTTSNWASRMCTSSSASNTCYAQSVGADGTRYHVAVRAYTFGIIKTPTLHPAVTGNGRLSLGGNANYSVSSTGGTSYDVIYQNEGAGNSVCFLKGDSSLYCSGAFAAGNGLTNVQSVAVGDQHACAVIVDGTIRCWGSNNVGQFGNASITQAGVSIYKVSGLTNAAKVYANGDHTCAITVEATVYCWGLGSSGQLGQGNTNSYDLPVQVFGVEGAESMQLGPKSSCATFSDKTIKCWGLNTSGQLFTGSTTNVLSPTTIGDFLVIQDLTPTPTIGGRTTEGQSLTAIPGTWDAGMNLSYQWNRGGSPISGATGIGYNLTAADVGQQISVTVTSQKPGWRTESRTSLATSAIESAQVNTPKPSISGTAKVASTLTATVGTWDGGVTTTLQWQRDGVAIAGATSSSYTLVSQDAGTRISVKVTGTKPGATTVSVTSDPTAGVLPGTQTLTPTPTLSGTAAVGRAITASIGSWDAGTSLAYQWFRGVNVIAGANSSTYTAVYDDLGYQLTLRVTSSKPGYDSVSVVSEPTLAVATGSLSATPTPLISGTVAVGKTLTVNPGVWDGAVALTYKWLKDGAEIDGQNSTTYTLVEADLNSSISVAVTGYKIGFASVTRTSLATVPVALGTYQQTTTPTISGTAAVGNTLNVNTGVWDPGVSLTLKWYRDGVEISGQTGLSYTLTPSDRTHSFSVEVTGSKTAYNTVVLNSATTNVVTWGTIAVAPVPTIVGTSVVGSVLTASPGVWDNGVSISYQWLRAGAPISGETGSNYSVLPTDRGLSISLNVVGTKSGYTTVTKSAVAVTIGYGALTFTPTPIITGTPIVGATLTVYNGIWDDGTSFTYQWLRAGVAVTGATGTSYSVSPSDRGTAITVTIIGSKTGYSSVTKTSSATTAVDYGVQSSQPVPQISGTLAVGNTLTALPGTWDTGTVLTYQWYRNGVAVSGATSTTFVLTSADRGAYLTVSVTSTKNAYTPVTLSSAQTGLVDYGTPILAPNPTITGTATVGSTITASAGTWDSGTTISYQWYRSGTPITGANATTYVLVADDYGADISVTATGSRPGYVTYSRIGALSTPVDFGTISVSPTPTISGTVKVGSTLTVSPGTWDNGVTLTYRWYRDGVERVGLTSSSYLLAPADFGSTISVVASGYKPGYRSVSKTSAATSAVGTGVQVLQPTPTISGTAAVGATLTANPGVWDSGVSLSYQWLRNGTAIAGATEYIYVLQGADRTATISVKVTSTKISYSDVSKTSGATPIVGAGTLTASPTPILIGTARVGESLSAISGYWDDGTTLSYQWQRSGRPISGAVTANYTIVGEDFNNTLSVVVTGSKDGYTSLSRTSAVTASVVAGPFVLFSNPTIQGNVGLGERLTADPGTWDSGVVFTYQWKRDGEEIPGANSNNYLINTADLSKAISVSVTGNKIGYVSLTLDSDATATINPLDITVAPIPIISGTASVGAILSVTVGTWTPGVSVGIQWYRGGIAIPGATSATYRLAEADEGLQMSVVTTGTKLGYESLSQESEPTEEVSEGLILRSPIPVLTGSAKVGATLVAVVGTWDTGVSLSYQWQRSGDPIDGATNATYALRSEDAGSTISLAVTGSRPGYAPKTVTSRATAAVAMGTLVMAQPRLQGVASVGQTLTATHLEANVADAEYYVQWYRSGTLIPGASEWTYIPGVLDVGKTLNVKVTVLYDGYKDLVLSSAKTSAVTLGTIAVRGQIVLTGADQPIVGSVITADAGNWDAGVVITYQWRRNGTAISGARSGTYIPVAADRGKKLTLTVTVSKAGYKTVTVTTPSTLKVL